MTWTMTNFPAISKGGLELGIAVERQDSGEMTHEFIFRLLRSFCYKALFLSGCEISQ